MQNVTATPGDLLIQSACVLDLDGDIHAPAAADVLVRAGRIAAVTPPGPLQDGPHVIQAGGKLLIPGLVNAHYHSYDVLAKGLLEDMPFDVWALPSQPAYFGPRSREELRARTLLGAVECLKAGITTVQDMNTLVPRDKQTLDTILSAYTEAGIGVVFSIAVRDLPALDIAPFLPGDVPAEVRSLIEGAPVSAQAELDFVARQIARLEPLPPRLSWALSPSGPQRTSRELLEGLAALSRQHGLPVLTHAYETKAQLARARSIYGAEGGSMVRHLADAGLLEGRTTLAHGVWLRADEIAMLAERGCGIVHNPVSNMKLKSGVAPMADALRAGVNVALGCDNCSCGDCQNPFQAMKALCLLAAVADPQPTGVLAAHALHAATLGGARALGLDGEVGALRPGMRADLALIDLADLAYVPRNSIARQLVFSESGRGVETVIVDGRVVVRDRRCTTVDEAALLAEVAEIMPGFRADFAERARVNAPAIPYLLEANRRVAALDLGLHRFVGQGGGR